VAAGIAALVLVAAAYWGPAALQSIVGRRSPAVEESAFDPRSAEQPQRVSLDTVHKISLAANQEMYFQLAAPGRDFRVVLDGRCITVTACSMNTALSVLDASGVVVEGATIHVIAFDVAFRRMLAVSLPAAGRIRVKLVNQSNGTLDYWLTVAGPETLAAVPYFGTVAPGPLQVGDEARGVLGPGAAAAYSLRLKPGKYIATLDFSVAPRGAESLGGAVAVFDTTAGEESTPVYIVHYGVSVRNSGPLSIPAEGVYLVRVQNQRDSAVNYIFMLTGG
jgi:hypothetical protein